MGLVNYFEQEKTMKKEQLNKCQKYNLFLIFF